MIPKIIHLCWLSGDKYPNEIQYCIESWKRHLPDYEIYLWDTNRFNINCTQWTKEAFEAKKYAFAADYIRLYALFHHGGIYLDSDVLVYKSFDDLLHLPYFIGEDVVHCFEPAIIGSEKGNPWIKEIMKRYENRHFIKEEGSLDMTSLPLVFHNILTPKYFFKLIQSKEEFDSSDKQIINIFSSDFFNSRDYVGIRQFSNSYCSHNFVGSWHKSDHKLERWIKERTPRLIANLYYTIIYNFIGRFSLKKKQIPYI